MAATTGRLLALAVCVVLTLGACGGGEDDEVGAELDAAAQAEAATTATTDDPPTTTTESTSTTLSELEQAEAEVARIVTEWYRFPIDTSLGEAGYGLDGTTGLLRRRIVEFNAQLAADGQFMRTTEPGRIDVTAVSVDLTSGTAEVETCNASSTELVDAETNEVLASEEPTFATTSVFQLQLTDGSWLINEWLPSQATDDPVECEIGA